MRGYELIEGQPPLGDYTLRIPMRGYEPNWVSTWRTRPVALRIPMRGYELPNRTLAAVANDVTNPHEGL